MVFKVGDLVFAKLKGYRPWPAQITTIDSATGKLSVFFYGTYETGQFSNDKNIWKFEDSTKEKFGQVSNSKRKADRLFLKGLKELEEKPQIAHNRRDLQPVQIRITSPDAKNKLLESATCEKLDRSRRKLYVQLKDLEDIIEIDLDKKKPLKFSSLKEATEWEQENLKEALQFKKLVEEGKYVPQEIVSKLEKKSDKTPTEKSVLDKWKLLQDDRAAKLNWLKTEMRLVALEEELRQCLHPTSPNLQRCNQILDEMNYLSNHISPLMFKKQPQVYFTMEKLRFYVGPSRGFGGSEINSDGEIVERIQSRAKSTFLKIQGCFNTPSNVPFNDYFNQEVEDYQQKCQDLSSEEKAFMTCENAL